MKQMIIENKPFILILNLLIILILVTSVGSVKFNFSDLDNTHKFSFNYSLYNNVDQLPVDTFTPNLKTYRINQIAVITPFKKTLFHINLNHTINIEHLLDLVPNHSRILTFYINNSPSKFVALDRLYTTNVINKNSSQYIWIRMFGLFMGIIFLEVFLLLIAKLLLIPIKTFKINLSNYDAYPLNSLFLFISILILFTQAYFTQQINMNIFVNSDELYLIDLCHDLYNGGNILSWHLPGGPSFFPDLIMIGLINLFTPKVYYIFYYFALIQITLCYILCYFVLKVILKRKVALFLSSVLIWFSVFAAIYEPIAFYTVLTPSFHFGSLLNTLLLLGILFRLFQSNFKNIFLYATFIIILTLAVISDRLISVWFVAPMIISLITLFFYRDQNSHKNILVFIVAAAIATIVGYVLLRIGFPHSLQPTQYFIFQNKVDFFKKIMFVMSALKDLQFYILDVFVWLFVYTSYKVNTQFKSALAQNIIIKFSAILYLVTLPVLSITLIIISYFEFSYRYLIILNCLTILVLLIYASRIVGAKIILCIITICFSSSMYNLLKQSFKPTYYPTDIVCIDNALLRYDVKYGIAHYWDARRFNYLSRISANIVPVDSDGSKHDVWMDTEQHQHKSYDFALLGTTNYYDLNESAILLANGKPIASVACSNYKLLIFKLGKLHLRGNVK